MVLDGNRLQEHVPWILVRRQVTLGRAESIHFLRRSYSYFQLDYRPDHHCSEKSVMGVSKFCGPQQVPRPMAEIHENSTRKRSYLLVVEANVELQMELNFQTYRGLMSPRQQLLRCWNF